MMTKVSVLVGVLWTLAALPAQGAQANATLTGETGLVNIPTAEILAPGQWRAAIHGNGEIETDGPADDRDLDRLDFSVALGLPWLDSMEVFSHLPLLFFRRHVAGMDDTTSIGGLRLGLKYRLLDESNGAPFGFALLGGVALGVGSDSLPAILDRTTAFGRREVYEVMGILDRSIWAMPGGESATLTLNAGGLFFDKPRRYSLDNQSTEFRRRFEGTDTTFEAPFEFGAGLRVPLLRGDLGKLTWTEEFRGNTGTVEQLRGSIPTQLFSGFRYQLPGNTGLTAQGGIDVSLSGILDQYRYTLGMMWQTPGRAAAPASLVARQAPAPLAPPAAPLKKIVLRGVHFDFDRWDIRADSGPILRAAAETLQENQDVEIVVEGHTDSMGSDAYNISLSLRRAVAVRDHLATLGVAFDRMTVAGRGERAPVAGNDSEEGRAQNRRVELLVQ